MPHKLAIDFGTTNSVVAHWNGSSAEIVSLPGLSDTSSPEQPPVIPSLLYVHDGQQPVTAAGQVVREQGLDSKPDNRLFRNFKRGIITPASEPRRIDSAAWTDRDAGSQFMRQLLSGLPYPARDIEQLALTVPVAAFEGYTSWLSGLITPIMPDVERVRLVDESTAAALGYAVTEPGALVLVFDFGGGSLDLSLVQLPESRERMGGFLGRWFESGRSRTAQVIAKAGRILGGSDVDHWLLAEALCQTGLTHESLGLDYAALLTRCEQAKIALSTDGQVELEFTAAGQPHQLTITQADIGTILKQNHFDEAVRQVIERVMRVARQQGIFKEDVQHVLMVGGTSLMPAVQSILREYFSDSQVRSHKPFTAVVEGALQVAAGYGLDDYLTHSYVLRHLEADQHAYEEIIPSGTRYPTAQPVEIFLSAAHAHQDCLEFVIGEVETDSVGMVEVSYQQGQTVFVARSNQNEQSVIALNADTPLTVQLKPAGKPGEDRLKVVFSVDAQRQLHVTVTDLSTRQKLLDDVMVVKLR